MSVNCFSVFDILLLRSLWSYAFKKNIQGCW